MCARVDDTDTLERIAYCFGTLSLIPVRLLWYVLLHKLML